MSTDPRTHSLQITSFQCITALLLNLLLILPTAVLAGDPVPSAPPGTGTMKTLQEIFDKLDLVQGEIAGSCGGQCNTDAFIPKTGQTTVFELGDDGDLQKGVAWPDPRFTDNGDGTITDNMTGLLWLEKNSCLSGVNWTSALDQVDNLASGQCSLTDGSQAGDWRVPNIRELLSLVDYSRKGPALPPEWGNYFSSGNAWFWSSTTWANYPSSVWILDSYFGRGTSNNKSLDCYDDSYDPTRPETLSCWGPMKVWAVRDPN